MGGVENVSYGGGLCFFRDPISVFTADAIVHIIEIVMIAIIAADGLGAGLHDSSISPEKSPESSISFCLF